MACTDRERAPSAERSSRRSPVDAPSVNSIAHLHMKKEAQKACLQKFSYPAEPAIHMSTAAATFVVIHTHPCLCSLSNVTYTHTHTQTHYWYHTKPLTSRFTSNMDGSILRPSPPVLCRGGSPASSLSRSCRSEYWSSHFANKALPQEGGAGVCCWDTSR